MSACSDVWLWALVGMWVWRVVRCAVCGMAFVHSPLIPNLRMLDGTLLVKRTLYASRREAHKLGSE